uniref:Reverse transcriptase domain-containing protein n=1 Tax=Cannabis sativa TaxID=3483 RepID=A0A803P9N5_CANSA
MSSLLRAFDKVILSLSLPFLLCAKGFSSLLRQQETTQALIGFKVARTALAISHLFFVDDSILLCQTSINSCNIIKEVLSRYERATGQQVNFQTSSSYFSPNVGLHDQTLISNYVHILVRTSFEKYLGLPQHIGRTKKQVFHYLIDKVWGHLNNWKHKVFSKEGKETLLKSVIQAIPTYTMTCFRLPIATSHSLDSIMANFGWGFNENNHHKTH